MFPQFFCFFSPNKTFFLLIFSHGAFFVFTFITQRTGTDWNRMYRQCLCKRNRRLYEEAEKKKKNCKGTSERIIFPTLFLFLFIINQFSTSCYSMTFVYAAFFVFDVLCSRETLFFAIVKATVVNQRHRNVKLRRQSTETFFWNETTMRKNFTSHVEIVKYSSGHQNKELKVDRESNRLLINDNFMFKSSNVSLWDRIIPHFTSMRCRSNR